MLSNRLMSCHGSIIIVKEDAREDVNGKTTTVEVTGTQASGFLYNVEWYYAALIRTTLVFLGLIKCFPRPHSRAMKNAYYIY